MSHCLQEEKRAMAATAAAERASFPVAPLKTLSGAASISLNCAGVCAPKLSVENFLCFGISTAKILKRSALTVPALVCCLVRPAKASAVESEPS